MLIIDRFEGEYAVIETDIGMVSIPRTDIPASAREGDVLALGISKAETGGLKERIDGKMDKLFKE